MASVLRGIPGWIFGCVLGASLGPVLGSAWGGPFGLIVAAPPPPPPGIDAAAILPRTADDSRAFIPLADVVAPRPLPPVGPVPNEPDPMRRLAADPAELDARMARGRSAASQRRWLEAVSEFEAVRAAGVLDVELHRYLAVTYTALGSPTRATEQWRRVLLGTPDDPEALLEVGIALVDAREGEQALDPLLRLRRVLEPETPSAPGAPGDADALPTPASRHRLAAQRVVAAYVLAEALWQSGFDLAGAEAAREAVRSLSDPALRSSSTGAAAPPGAPGLPNLANRAEPAERAKGANPSDGPHAMPSTASLDERLENRLGEVRRRADALLDRAAEAFLRCGRCDAALETLVEATGPGGAGAVNGQRPPGAPEASDVPVHEHGFARPTALQRARRLAAYRCAGRADEALRWWIRSLGIAPDRVERADAAVAEWFTAWLRDEPARTDGIDPAVAGALAAALRDGTASLALAHPRNANLLAVAAAAHGAEDRARMLRDGAVAMPEDQVLLGQALRATAALPDGVDAAVRFAIQRVDEKPLASAEVAAQLATLPAGPDDLVAALDANASDGIGAVLLRLELAVLWDDPAAFAGAAALPSDDPAIAPARLALRARAAAALGAPEHAKAVAAECAAAFTAESAGPPALLVGAVAEALVRAGQPEAAWRFVDPIVRPVANGGDASMLATVAEVALATAAALPEETAGRRARLATVERLARAALVDDPGEELAWRVLLTLMDPHGTFVPDAFATGALTRELERLVRGITADEEIVARPGLEPLLRRLEIQADAVAGRRESAIAALMQLAEADPTDEAALQLVGAIWRQEGSPAEAEAWFRRHAEAQPSNPFFARGAVDAAIAADRPENAVRWLEGRQDPVADALRGRALAAAGDLPAARAQERARIERRPDGPQRDLDLARLDAEGDRIDHAVDLLESVMARAASPAQRRGALAIAVGIDRLALRDPRRIDDLVVRLVDVVLGNDATLPLSVHTAALVAEVRRGADHDRLQRTIDRALRSPAGRMSSPEAVRGWLGMGQALVGLWRGDLAAEILRRRLEDGPPPEAQGAMLLRAAALTADIASRDVEGTIARLPALRRAARETGFPPISGDEAGTGLLDPATPVASILDAEILVWLSNRWTLMDDDAGAETLLREALRRAPGHGMASNNLGWLLLELDGDAEPAPEVVELIESAARALPASASVIDSLGWLRYRQGQMQDEEGRPGAVTLLRRAVALAGEQVSAELLDHLGDALWAAGEEGEALSTWRRAITMIDRTAPREQMLTVLLEHQQREYGLVLADPRDLYQRLYGRVRDRMVEKLLGARGNTSPE